MGQHISVEHMQGDLDILCLMCTLVYIQYMGFLEAQADIYKLQPSFVAYTLHLRHRERGCRGLWSQVEMLWLKIKKDIILLFQKYYFKFQTYFQLCCIDKRDLPGLQFGGDPIIWGWQVHWQVSPLDLGGLLFGPQGLGLHGSSTTTGAKAKTQLCHFKFQCKIVLQFSTYLVV